jgi:hypothetical protein
LSIGELAIDDYSEIEEFGARSSGRPETSHRAEPGDERSNCPESISE